MSGDRVGALAVLCATVVCMLACGGGLCGGVGEEAPGQTTTI
jgi:hypothetical protein